MWGETILHSLASVSLWTDHRTLGNASKESARPAYHTEEGREGMNESERMKDLAPARTEGRVALQNCIVLDVQWATIWNIDLRTK